MASPKLIVMSGLPGSGKSTLANRIATELILPIFSVDPIESAIIKSGISKSFETGYAAYLVARDLAAEQVKLGQSVIIDAANAEDEAKQVWIDASEKLKVPLLIIECVVKNKSLHRDRIESRVRGLHGIDEVTWAKVEARRKLYTDWDRDTLRLDMENDPDENLQKSIKYIGSFSDHKN